MVEWPMGGRCSAVQVRRAVESGRNIKPHPMRLSRAEASPPHWRRPQPPRLAQIAHGNQSNFMGGAAGETPVPLSVPIVKLSAVAAIAPRPSSAGTSAA